MGNIQAVVVDPSVTGRLTLREVPAPTPTANEALVRVAAMSLNRGEVQRSTTADAGWQPGWDLAGTIKTAAADGSSPAVGTRVVGFVRAGGWGELVAVPTTAIAALPDAVSFAPASTNAQRFYGTSSGARLYALMLFHETSSQRTPHPLVGGEELQAPNGASVYKLTSLQMLANIHEVATSGVCNELSASDCNQVQKRLLY